MIYAPFDVVVVPFPYSDGLSEKRRPALVVSSAVVSSAVVSERLDRLWVAMITSAVRGAGFGDAQITDLDAAGLRVASMIRASKLATVDAGRVLRRLGRLGQEDMTRAMAALQDCAAFCPP